MKNTAPQTPDAVVQSVISKVTVEMPIKQVGIDEVIAIQNSILAFANRLNVPIKPFKPIAIRLNERSLVGIEKYKTTLQEADLSQNSVLQHAVEELLDAANYLEKLYRIYL
jgi:hypothetical protein